MGGEGYAYLVVSDNHLDKWFRDPESKVHEGDMQRNIEKAKKRLWISGAQRQFEVSYKHWHFFYPMTTY